MPSIIQFIHPGGEHTFDSIVNNQKYKEWHTGDHRRKYSIGKGKYFSKNSTQKGEMLFWCEWEPPSFVEKLPREFNEENDLVYPKYLHTPFLPPMSIVKSKYQKGAFQNTDPFIFGKNFLYSICKIDHYRCLQNLENGSLILFGSCVKTRFVIDTVFVVKDSKPYSIPLVSNLKSLDIYSEIVLKMSGRHEKKDRRIYTGASFDDTTDSINNMFSFVPAVNYIDKKRRVPRFCLGEEAVKEINSYFSKWTKNKPIINDKLKQGIINNQNIDIKEVCYLWKLIKEKALKGGYVLGYNFDMPLEKNIQINPIKKKKPNKTTGCSRRQGC